MAEQQFTHLHIHSEYSLLDGATRLEQLIERVTSCGMTSIALSDHGNIFGAVKFFDLCKKAGIKPILGMEAYMTEDAKVKDVNNKYYHILLLVQNEIGYKNLCKLISFSFNEGFYFKPRIDYAMLEQYNEGLIASTACLGGHIPTLVLAGQREAAEKQIQWFIRVFGRERFFLEVQPVDQPEQEIANNFMYEMGPKYDLNVIATTDAHYPTPDYREAHEVMLCIQTHHKLADSDRMSFQDCRPWVRSLPEMLEAFKGHEEALWNTQKVVDQCNFKFATGKLFFPIFEVPAHHTQESYFKELCQQGYQRLIDTGHVPLDKLADYQARLDMEMELITRMGFVGYFLIVGDFISWARSQKIPATARGSAAGSMVAWTLAITNLDPIKYNLFFERFLNPERVSMPDIDIDFCVERRANVIQYVRDKYGTNKVCSIITFGTMAAKGVLKDVARVLGLPFEDANAITNLVPDQLKISLEEALKQEPRLEALKNSNPRVAQLFDLAFRLEGVTRHASKHAAGIVILPQPIDESLPVYIPPKSSELVTQYSMTDLEQLGFLKIDFLGVKNLTLIDRVVNLVKQTRGVALDMDLIALDDSATFALTCQGKTSGVFQLESDGLKDVLRRLQPDKFEDLIAVNALYRPGPLGSGMVDDYIERRHGRQKISYVFAELEPILQETYGVIVYQEQVMKVASAIGGYSLGEADILRRAMGKKKVEVMEQNREIFFKRAVERGFDGKKAGELFDLLAYFAGYGFNKSHSAVYAKISYQTAYLKAHFAPEFMACLISLEANDAEKMSFYLDEAKAMGMGIRPPDINRSAVTFSVVDGDILFGLQGIKNVGDAALETIMVERAKKPFADVLDFCSRVDLRTVNKRVIENFIYAGAFDCLPGNRAQQQAELETILEQALEHKKHAMTGQMGLFGAVKTSDTAQLYVYQPIADWPVQEMLEHEKEVIGFYLSAHPLDSYKPLMSRIDAVPIAQVRASVPTRPAGSSDREPLVTCCGFLKSHRIMFTKKGERMAFAQIEDLSGTAEIVIFPRLFATIEQWLETHHVFVVKGSLDQATDQCKLKANVFMPLEVVFENLKSAYRLTVQVPTVLDGALVEQLKKQVKKGDTPLVFAYRENERMLNLKTRMSVLVEPALIEWIEAHECSVRVTL